MSRRSAVKGCYSCNYSFGYKCVKIPLCLITILFSHNAAQPLSASVTTQCSSFVHVQNDQYTVGGSERFDTLTDLVEHYKRKGIEEVSGNWVYFKQVNRVFLSVQIVELKHVRVCNISWVTAAPPPPPPTTTTT